MASASLSSCHPPVLPSPPPLFSPLPLPCNDARPTPPPALLRHLTSSAAAAALAQTHVQATAMVKQCVASNLSGPGAMQLQQAPSVAAAPSRPPSTAASPTVSPVACLPAAPKLQTNGSDGGDAALSRLRQLGDRLALSTGWPVLLRTSKLPRRMEGRGRPRGCWQGRPDNVP